MKIEYYVEFGERSSHTGRYRLRGIENFILSTFINFKPVKRVENKSGMSEFRSFNNGMSKGVLEWHTYVVNTFGRV